MSARRSMSLRSNSKIAAIQQKLSGFSTSEKIGVGFVSIIFTLLGALLLFGPPISSIILWADASKETDTDEKSKENREGTIIFIIWGIMILCLVFLAIMGRKYRKKAIGLPLTM